MKNKIYPFLLGLSCIMIVALVSFKNGGKAVEREQMIVVAQGIAGNYDIFISTAGGYESIDIKETPKGFYKYSGLLNKIEELEKQGWRVSNSNLSFQSDAVKPATICYTLEREKKQQEK